MCYICSGSSNKIVHTDNCRYVKMMAESGKKTFSSLRAATNADYIPCKYCSPVKKHLDREKERLEEFCKQTDVRFFYNTKKGTLDVISKSGKWKIVVDDNLNALVLYHYSNGSFKHSDVIPGYHKQHVERGTLLNYVKYIAQHDNFRQVKPLYARQTNDKLTKGSKKWKKQQRREENMRKTQSIRYVTELLNNMAQGNIPY